MSFSVSINRLVKSGGLALSSALAVFFIFVASTTASADEYIIGAGDTVIVSVWGEPDLGCTALVRPDGKISLPGAGEIAAEGLTPLELQKEVSRRLSSLVKEPVVTISMADIVNSNAYIVGGGVAPGIFVLKQKTTLLQLMTNVDLTRADLSGAHIIRNQVRLDTDFNRLLHKGDITQDVTLRNNDIIFFPAQLEPYVYMLGAFNAPRALPYREGLTVLDAILECGGFNKFADKNDTVIVRREAEHEIRIPIKARKLIEGKDLSQNVLLRQGDYVVASESFF